MVDVSDLSIMQFILHVIGIKKLKQMNSIYLNLSSLSAWYTALWIKIIWKSRWFDDYIWCIQIDVFIDISRVIAPRT